MPFPSEPAETDETVGPPTPGAAPAGPSGGTSDRAPDRASDEAPRGGLRGWAAVVAAGVGIFTLVTIEELPIGVLTLVSDDLGVPPGIVGLAVTLPGVLAAAIALVAPVLTARFDRRMVLVTALAAVVVSCVLSVLSAGVGSLLFSRVFAGIAIGLYWPAMPVLVVRQVRPEKAPLALTIAFAGTGSAVVLGVPFASWLGALMGWREAFVVVGALALAVLVLQLVLLRPVRADEPTRLGDLLTAFRRRGVRYPVAMAALAVTGQFLTYSYVSPLLQETAGIGVDSVPMMLLIFGVAGIVGNFAIAPLLTRSPGGAAVLITTGMALALVAVQLLARGVVSTAVIVGAWGLFAGAISVVMQTFVTRYAGRYEEAATALNSTTFNLAIAMGALVGGRLVDALGVRAPGWVSVVMVAIAGALAVRWLVTGGDRDRDTMAGTVPAP
ncbi:MFS transporter [Brachybacterium huguangmaarense]